MDFFGWVEQGHCTRFVVDLQAGSLLLFIKVIKLFQLLLSVQFSKNLSGGIFPKIAHFLP